MLTFFVATSYFFWVITGVLFHFNTYFTHKVSEALKHIIPLRGVLLLLQVHVSIRAELPLHLFFFKVIIVKLTSFLGGFDYWFAWLTYYLLDLPSLIICLHIFWEMLQDKELIQTTLYDMNIKYQLKDFISLPWLTRFINPIWKPTLVNRYPDISYSTLDEAEASIQSTGEVNHQRNMTLDVYTSTSRLQSKNLRPTLIHIHGGAWVKGTKNIFYPHEKLLVSEDDWVVVNIAYRLAPKNPYPTHLFDVKRAIRWVKTNIDKFGGDPNFIVLSGDSAGGHLAAMAMLTANDPKWQPGFESIDTSIRGLISFNGALDIQSDELRKNFFTHKVAMQDKIDQDFLNNHSPLYLIQQPEMEKKLVPSLIFAGQRDGIVDFSIGLNFKAAFKRATSNVKCQLIVFPAAHHVWYIFWSSRSFYGAQLVQAYCRQLLLDNNYQS
ncbi:unnamed protein product [Cunninghamella blakesleeana]